MEQERLRQLEVARAAKEAAEKAEQDRQLKERVEALTKQNMALQARLFALEESSRSEIVEGAAKSESSSLSSSVIRRNGIPSAKPNSKKLYFPTNAAPDQTQVLDAVFGQLER